MEIVQYFLLLRKWTWLLILGAILGGMAAYGFSLLQPTVYQTSTQVMVSRTQNSQDPNYLYSAYADTQLAENYSRMITTQPVIQTLGDKLGYPVKNSYSISAKQTPNTNLLIVTVAGNDPNRIVEVANGLIGVFVDYNTNLQEGRYKSTEDSLKAQITQIEGQISTLQDEMSKITATTQETQKQQLEDQAKQLEKLLSQTDQEVIQIEAQLETFIPTPMVTNTPAPSWIIPTATPVPVPTPTLSSAEAIKYKELQVRRDQLNEMRTMFQKAYGDLLVLKQNNGADPALRQNQIQTTLALYQQIYSNLLSSYENVRLTRLRDTPTIVQIEPAVVPSTPIQPKPMRNALVGAISGVLIMGAIAFLIEYLDDTLKTPEDVHRYLELPVLGLIGEMGPRKGKKSENGNGVFVAEKPLSPVAEAFRTLRANLDFAGLDKPIKTLQITSAGPSEGKSTVAVNLAAVLAQGGRKVVLLDADLRRPAINKYLSLANRKGLTDILRDPKEIPNIVTEWGDPPVRVITTGELPPNPTELLDSERMGKVLDELKLAADIIIIDSAPTIITDPIVLAAKVDGVLVVIEPGGTKIGSAQVMLEQLNRAGARVIGVVLNPISNRRSNYYTKYNYYSSYYRSSGYHRYTSESEHGERKSDD
jgi:polysaccharide biosynthesis transport protein